MRPTLRPFIRIFSLVILVFSCQQISASPYDFKSGKLYYDILSSTERTVTVASGDEALGSVTIPPAVINSGTTYKVTGISNMAFCDNTALTAVSIPSSILTIGTKAFYASGLTSITIPENVTSIGEYAFGDCTNLDKIIFNAVRAETTDEVFSGKNKNYSTTSVIIGNKVEIISESLFGNLKNITEIIVPSSVKEIHDNAFYSCEKLETVSLPETLTFLGIHPFEYTACIEKQSGIAYIGSYVHSYEGKMPPKTHLQIKDGTKGIGGWAFRAFSELTTIDIPETVTFIGKWAFSDCNSLKSIKLPTDLVSIENGAFNSCTTLKSIDIPNKVKFMGDCVFWDCTGLEEMTYGESLEVIDGLVFYHWIESCNVKILNYNCLNPQKLDFPTTIEVLNIGNKVNHISASFYYNSNTLKTVNFGSSVELIKENAFSNCKQLTSIVFPESLKTIEEGAFSGSPLKSITSLNPIPPVCDSGVFDSSTKEEAELNIPEGSITAYREAEVWKEFRSLGTSIESLKAEDIFHFDISTNVLSINGVSGILSVFHISGSKVFETTVENEDISIDLSNLPVGAYILHQGGKSYKFIKR